MEVIIKIKIDDAVLARMRKGEFVQGSLHYDQWTGEKQFNAYVRKSRLPGLGKEIDKAYQGVRVVPTRGGNSPCDGSAG